MGSDKNSRSNQKSKKLKINKVSNSIFGPKKLMVQKHLSSFLWLNSFL